MRYMNRQTLSLTLGPYLFRYSLCCLFGVIALVNDITDLLAVHDEVDAICGEREEGIVYVMQLHRAV